MARWLRFLHDGAVGFGLLADDGTIRIHQGDMFDSPEPTGRILPLGEVRLLTPTEPTKMLALWNNFHALAEKLSLSRPEHPLYLLKASNAFLPSGAEIG